MIPRSILSNSLVVAAAFFWSPVHSQSDEIDVELKGKVLFLGDSITHSGHYISAIEAVMLSEGVDLSFLQIRQRNLEDLFLQLTGRELRL